MYVYMYIYTYVYISHVCVCIRSVYMLTWYTCSELTHALLVSCDSLPKTLGIEGHIRPQLMYLMCNGS